MIEEFNKLIENKINLNTNEKFTVIIGGIRQKLLDLLFYGIKPLKILI